MDSRDAIADLRDSSMSMDAAVPEVWVARMLRAGGALILMFTAFSLGADLSQQSAWEDYSLCSDAIALLVGSLAFARARFLSARQWKPIILCALSLLVVNYWISVAFSHDLESLLYPVVLLAAGTGALTPWESPWQFAFNTLCVLAWGSAAILFPDDSLPMLSMWFLMITAAGIGQVGAYVRNEFARENLAARRKVSASETRLRKILNASPDAVLIIRDRDLLVKEVLGGNRSLSSAGLLGQPLSDEPFGGMESRFAEAIEVVREQGEIRNFEMDFKSPDGARIPILASAARIEIDGEAHIVSFARDIRELRQAQIRAEEGVRRAHDILTALEGVVGIAVLVDDRFVEYYGSMPIIGYTRDETIGRSVEELELFADPAESEEYAARMRRDGHVTGMDIQARGKGGKITPILLSISPTQIDGNAAFIAVVLDISEAKESRHRLAESQLALGKVEEQFRAIVEQAFDAILVVDGEGRISVWNRGAELMFGWSAAEAIGQPVVELTVPERLREANRKGIARFLKTGGGSILRQIIKGLLVRRNGEEFPIELAVSRIAADGYSTVIRDVSQRKAEELELINAREAALAASHAKSEFLSSMSHEIRTPMNAVLGMGELLSDTELDPEQRRFLDVMNANGAALLELINSILDLARIESGRMQIEKAEFDLNKLLERCIATFGIRAHSKGLELSVRIAPGTPEHLVGDPLRLRQVLTNLVGNAIKFTELGEVALLVQNDPDSAEPGALRFSVTDTGIGIAPDKIESLFDSFTQADSSTTRQYGGSGLGLAIARRLVGLMSGRIWIESELNRGSRFIFNAQFELAEKPISAPVSGGPDLTGYRVLVVDDNATNRLIASEILATLGASVIEAASGSSALAAVRVAADSGRALDLIFLDMRMPGMDGLETAERIRNQLHATVPLVLMLSSDDLKPQLARMQKAGLKTYLVKPILRRELFEATGRVLATARREDPLAEKVAPPPLDAIEMSATSILVAEDSPDNRLLISAYLRRSHCTVEFAVNGQEAFEMFKRGHYDLVLMDLQMPVMDGFAATRAIRQWELDHHAPRTSIVALTASAMSEDVIKVREAGCDAHVGKPFQKATLFRVIREYAHAIPAVAA